MKSKMGVQSARDSVTHRKYSVAKPYPPNTVGKAKNVGLAEHCFLPFRFGDGSSSKGPVNKVPHRILKAELGAEGSRNSCLS